MKAATKSNKYMKKFKVCIKPVEMAGSISFIKDGQKHEYKGILSFNQDVIILCYKEQDVQTSFPSPKIGTPFTLLLENQQPQKYILRSDINCELEGGDVVVTMKASKIK
jgi:hypothetical protein